MDDGIDTSQKSPCFPPGFSMLSESQIVAFLATKGDVVISSGILSIVSYAEI
jgi:hypothetical protein